MARQVPNNKLTRTLTQGIPTESTENLVATAGEALRLKILADRTFRGFEQADVNGPPNAYEYSDSPIFGTYLEDRKRRLDDQKIGKKQVSDIGPNNYTSEPANTRQAPKPIQDSISIVDIDFTDKNKGNRGYSYITLPFVPRELSYSSSSRFIGIATMGRNNPFYQFTGSEDTLQFDIDWFSFQHNRQDVINSCRWVEALSKSDGYEEPPHRVKLVWGQDDLLWQNDIWLVVDAPYTLSEFVKSSRNPVTSEIDMLGMMPQQAIQKITLKRVVGTNMRSSEVIGKLSNVVDYGK